VHISRRIARLVILTLVVPAVAVFAAPGTARATTGPNDWLGEANYLRTFWNVTVPTLTEDATLSANDQAHDHYLDENQTCGHTEDKSNPYYTDAGAYGGTHSVVYCAALGPVNDVDGWSRTPLHGEQVLNPQLTVTGFAETSLNGGHAAMDTLTHYADGAAPAVPATWPNGTDFPFTHFAGGEIDYTGGDAVLDNCGATYSADEASLGAPIFVDLPGAAHSAVPASSSDVFLKDGNGTSQPVCLFDSASPVAPFMSTAVLLPLHAFTPGMHYTASYTAGGATGTWSFTVATQPPGPPSTVHVSSSGNQSATLTWAAPTDNGGSAITGYKIQQYDASDAHPDWVDSTDNAGASNATNATVTGLTNGDFYYFRVAAINVNGTGGYSDFSDNYAYPQPGAPGKPTGVGGNPSNAQVTVSWTAPVDNGGSPIQGYDVQYSSNSGASWTSASATFHSSTATQQTVTGLTDGTAYLFRVAAINAYGTGSYSDPSSPVTPQADLPGKPTNVSAVAGNNQATVSWTAPADNGGSAILGYDVEKSDDGGATWQPTSSTFHSDTATTQTVSGLTNGTAYVFRVAAINAKGTGSYSNPSAPVTPSSTPADPSTLTAQLTTASSVTYPQPVGFSVHLTDTTTGDPIATATVNLMQRTTPAGAWTKVLDTTTGPDGSATATVTPQRNVDYEWQYADTAGHQAATSTPISVTVAAAVTAEFKKTTVARGHHAVLKGLVAPNDAGQPVKLQAKKHGHWRSAHQSATLSSHSKYRFRFTAKHRGHFRYRVVTAATGALGAGTSATQKLKVR
jgi:5-hydroxyisourate hydrolase-like protein (transthyretin family)